MTVELIVHQTTHEQLVDAAINIISLRALICKAQ